MALDPFIRSTVEEVVRLTDIALPETTHGLTPEASVEIIRKYATLAQHLAEHIRKVDEFENPNKQADGAAPGPEEYPAPGPDLTTAVNNWKRNASAFNNVLPLKRRENPMSTLKMRLESMSSLTYQARAYPADDGMVVVMAVGEYPVCIAADLEEAKDICDALSKG